MQLTNEQQAVVTHIENITEDSMVLIDAVAGAGKTSLLTEIVAKIPHTNGIYIAYNKSVATEASTKFPSTISCSTTHSLAYRAVVKALGLRVGNFSYRDITENIPYEVRLEILDLIKEFCLSSYICIEDYAKDNKLSPVQLSLCTKYLNLMYSGAIECTHDFYMKAFHMHLADGSITYPKQDFVLVDEAGDLNEVTLAIFMLLPARVKIAVGDSAQNIYSFNHTVNAFHQLQDKGVSFRLTESFRVSAEIAERIQHFCTNNISKDMLFKGQVLTDHTITTRAFIARTNAGLIGTMIELAARKVDFTLVRKASAIFSLPLTMCFVKYQGKINNPGYGHLQSDIDDWYEDQNLMTKYKSPHLYLASLYEFDVSLMSAIRLVQSKGKSSILAAYDFAKACERKRTNLYIATSHSVKGLEFDEVNILDDLNDSVNKVLFPEKDISDEDRQQEINLYYVACSRGRKKLNNAKAL
jgi:F-box protein 18 (helicase)